MLEGNKENVTQKKVFLQKDELIMPIRSQKTERKSNEAVKK